MPKSIIKVDNLSKRYRIGIKERQSETLVGQLSQAIISPWKNFRRLQNLSQFGNDDDSVFWALKDISFDVKEGEVLGVIGKNGAGKSTLLKILSQITEPTLGKVEIHGRVASLLEVGTGFHPELSGRENIFMNGTILGMTKKEIDSRLEEIIDFSGVEKFIDTPVKYYSSGMKVRLAFSVAAYLDPEILIIDEVLAVGDYDFQRKCLGKMEDVSKNQGRTVLFVSHQMDAINRLCSRLIVLKDGCISFDGLPNNGIKEYFGQSLSGNSAIIKFENSESVVGLTQVQLKSNSIILGNSVSINEEIEVEILFQIFSDQLKVSSGINVYNEFGDHLFSSHHTNQMKSVEKLNRGIYSTSVFIPPNFFSEGLIYFSIALMDYEPFQIFENKEKVISVFVIDKMDGDSSRGIYTGTFPGLIRPKLNWTDLKKLD